MGIDKAKEIMERVVVLSMRLCQTLDDVKTVVAAWDVVKASIPVIEEGAGNDREG